MIHVDVQPHRTHCSGPGSSFSFAGSDRRSRANSFRDRVDDAHRLRRRQQADHWYHAEPRADAGRGAVHEGRRGQQPHPHDYQRRVAIIYTFLKGATAKVLTEVTRSDDKSTLAVEVTRSDCRKRIPITLEKTKDDRWMVTSIELGALGTPGRACPPEEQRPPSD